MFTGKYFMHILGGTYETEIRLGINEIKRIITGYILTNKYAETTL